MFMAGSFWALLITAVSSAPTDAFNVADLHQSHLPRTFAKPRDSERIEYGDTQVSRTIYTIVSMVCLSLLTGMLGYRARQLERQHLKNLNLTRILVLVLYFLAISFVVSAAVVQTGLGLSSQSICHSAIAICLTFYVGGKVTMYVFLVERAHAIRAPYMRRRADWIWLLGMFIIAAGFGSIAVCGFLWPIADMSTKDGRCRIGLPLKVTIPLLTFDVIINTALTAVFIYFLRPLLRFGILSNTAFTDPSSRISKRIRRALVSTEIRRSTDIGSADLYRLNQGFHKSIEALLWKTLIGSILVMLPTVANITVMYAMKGRELAWMCLTICSCDVTWAVAVIHWLTIGSTDIDERDLVMLAQHDSSSASTVPAPSIRDDTGSHPHPPQIFPRA